MASSHGAPVCNLAKSCPACRPVMLYPMESFRRSVCSFCLRALALAGVETPALLCSALQQEVPASQQQDQQQQQVNVVWQPKCTPLACCRCRSGAMRRLPAGGILLARLRCSCSCRPSQPRPTGMQVRQLSASQLSARMPVAACWQLHWLSLAGDQLHLFCQGPLGRCATH